MENKVRVVLVTGATGKQGGATARHLLAGGWPVRALTRDPKSPAAQALVKAGAEVVQGDLDDRASLDRALSGVYGVYSMQTPYPAGVDVEERQGKALADAAGAAGVEHFVYASVGGAERNTGISHFESKWAIEKHVGELSLPATILRPVFFMENFNAQRESIRNGTFTSRGLKPDKPLQLIAANDVGAFAALAFAYPQDYVGLALELAGDELTEPQIVETLAKVIGRPVTMVPYEGPPRGEDFARMIKWFNEEGYQADIPDLRARYPRLLRFETWLWGSGWARRAEP
jgi:uncharacterized protein YbjT (DUF2867 family)